MNNPLGLQRGTVRLAEYNPEWKQLFRKEQSLLKEALGNKFISVEHVGSTAIPGIKAKPVLDIMLAIADLDDWEQIQEPLAALGYKFRKDFRKEQQHILFVKGPEANRTHYLKVTELNSKFWTENILFRDFLVNNPKYRDEYGKTKEQLCKNHQDNRELYTKGKEEFIRRILELAKYKQKI